MAEVDQTPVQEPSLHPVALGYESRASQTLRTQEEPGHHVTRQVLILWSACARRSCLSPWLPGSPLLPSVVPVCVVGGRGRVGAAPPRTDVAPVTMHPLLFSFSCSQISRHQPVGNKTP